jgi:AcrR family transcriptional regulator
MARTTGEHTKTAIRAVALNEFATWGYGGVALEQIAAELGITRSAILHHFGSKAHLLQAIVEPLETAIDGLLSEHDGASVPLRAEARDALLTKLVAIYCDFHVVLRMLWRDVSSNWPIQLPSRMHRRVERLVVLLAGEAPGVHERLVVNALMGTLVRPVIDPTTDTDDERVRAILVRMVSAASHFLDSASLDSASS